MTAASKNHSFNRQFMVLSLALLGFGLIMLTSASQVIGWDDFNDPYYYLKHQIIFGLLPGLLFLIFAARVPYHIYEKYARFLFALAVILILLVFVPGIGFTHAGASRWLTIAGISIQPSEIIKLALVIFLASWFAKRHHETRNFYYTFLPFTVILAGVSILIALQPDIGTLGVVVVIALSIYWVAGIPKRHALLFLLLAVFAFVLLVKTAPYRIARIGSYLNPKEDQLGASYQINQSLIAIGSGGLFGRGIGQSKQKYRYLPEAAGDSIFAVIAEELGFVVTAGFIILYMYFIIHGFRLAENARDLFGKYIICGIMSWFAAQAIVNMGSMVGLLPLTGLPLPFVSYGGSALVVSLTGVGLVMNISRYRKS